MVTVGLGSDAAGAAPPPSGRSASHFATHPHNVSSIGGFRSAAGMPCLPARHGGVGRVEAPFARPPPHGSGRAAFPHPAPREGDPMYFRGSAGHGRFSPGRWGTGATAPGTEASTFGCGCSGASAEDPASGLHARAKCAGPGNAHEPAPRFRGGRLRPAGPDRDRWERSEPVSRCRPKACPRESEGNRAVQRTHPFRAPRPHLTHRERHHYRERQAHARALPGQASQEVLFELEAAVQTGVDPFQGRAPAVAALPCGAPVGGGG